MKKSQLLLVLLSCCAHSLLKPARALGLSPPPLYWTPYEYNYVHDDFIPENVFKANVDWVAEKLKPFGYDMIVTDGWIYGNTAVDANGFLAKYNNSWAQGLAYWQNYLAQKGLKLGIYYNPLWIQDSAYQQNGKVKGTNYTIRDIAGIKRSDSRYKKYWIDPSKPGAKEYVQAYVAYFKAMNIKLLRLDFLSEFEDLYGPANYDKVLGWIHEAAGNNLIISLVMPNAHQIAATEVKYGDMMRVSEDSFQGAWGALSGRQRGEFFPKWPSLRNAFDGFVYFSPIAGRGRMILDGDAIRLNTFASDIERRSCITLYAMAGSPIPIADQVDTIGASLSLYENPEVLALSKSWFVGKPLSSQLGDADNQRWAGQTQDGSWIVALFNRESTPETRGIDFKTEFGLSGPVRARDLWKHEDLAVLQKSYSVRLAPHESVLLKISAKNE